jgi:chromosome segregation ATPase
MDRLLATVRELAEAQKRTDELVRELAEAQKRTDAQIAQLSARVDELAEAQKRTDAQIAQLSARVDELAEAQKRTDAQIAQLSARVDELAEAQKRTEEQLAKLSARVDELAEAQKRTEARLEALAARVQELTEAQKGMEERLQKLEAIVAELVEQTKELRLISVQLVSRTDALADRTDWLLGDALERRFRERAPSYFQRLLRRLRVFSQERLANLLDDAAEEGRITEEEREALLRADLVAEGKRDGEPVALLAEVSFKVDRYDVERAAERAKMLEKVLGVAVIPAVGGAFVDDRVWPVAQELGVEVIQDQWSAERFKRSGDIKPIVIPWQE